MVDKELSRYYEETFSMMSTDGWKFLMEDLQKIVSNLEDVRKVADTNDLRFRQGQIDILDLLLTRKATCEAVYEELLHETNG